MPSANRQQRRSSRAAGRKQTGAVDMAEPETPAQGQREPRATTPATGAKRSIAELYAEHVGIGELAATRLEDKRKTLQ